MSPTWFRQSKLLEWVLPSITDQFCLKNPKSTARSTSKTSDMKNDMRDFHLAQGKAHGTVLPNDDGGV